MTDADLVLIGAISSAVLQAVKRLGLHSDLYGVVLIMVGVAAGAGLSYARGNANIADGAVSGIVAALAAGGVYGVSKSAGETITRDARGRFARRDKTG